MYLIVAVIFAELMFLETSALTGENVEEAFVQCARKILNKIESGTVPPVHVLVIFTHACQFFFFKQSYCVCHVV